MSGTSYAQQLHGEVSACQCRGTGKAHKARRVCCCTLQVCAACACSDNVVCSIAVRTSCCDHSLMHTYAANGMFRMPQQPRMLQLLRHTEAALSCEPRTIHLSSTTLLPATAQPVEPACHPPWPRNISAAAAAILI
jgi:hypothetical protein